MHLGDNWEETQDKNGNSRCYCKIPYEDRLEIDDGGKEKHVFMIQLLVICFQPIQVL